MFTCGKYERSLLRMRAAGCCCSAAEMGLWRRPRRPGCGAGRGRCCQGVSAATRLGCGIQFTHVTQRVHLHVVYSLRPLAFLHVVNAVGHACATRHACLLNKEHRCTLACCECGAALAQAAAQAEAARAEAAAHQTKEQELWASARAAGNEASHIASTKARALRRCLPTLRAVAESCQSVAHVERRASSGGLVWLSAIMKRRLHRQ